MSATAEETARYRDMGANAFIVSSDQGFMRQAALKAYAEISGVGKK